MPRSGQCSLSEAQIAKAVELREERGWSLRRIANKLGCKLGTIEYQLLRRGVDRPGGAASVAKPPSGPPSYVRNGYLVRRFSPEEDAAITAMSINGLNNGQIARRLTPPRPANSIKLRLMFLARAEARAELAAERAQHAATMTDVRIQASARAG